MLQGEVRAAVDGLAKDLRQAYTGNGNPGLEKMLPAQLQFLSPDRQTPFHLRRVNYKLSNRTLQRASALSTNTGAPPWTFPALSAYRDEVGSVANTTVFKYYDAAGVVATHGDRRRVGDDHAHRRQQDVAEPPVHLRDERRAEGGPMSAPARSDAPRGRRDDGADGARRRAARRALAGAAELGPGRVEPRQRRGQARRVVPGGRGRASTRTCRSSSTTRSSTTTTWPRASRRAARRRLHRHRQRHGERRVDVRARLDVPERLRQVVSRSATATSTASRSRRRARARRRSTSSPSAGPPARRRTTGRSRRSCARRTSRTSRCSRTRTSPTAPSPRRRARSTRARTRTASSTTSSHNGTA